jgi:hypothetical protein
VKEWYTFNEWRDLGKRVKQEEKATWFDDVPKFSKFQVEDISDYEDYPSGWEDCSIYDTY